VPGSKHQRCDPRLTEQFYVGARIFRFALGTSVRIASAFADETPRYPSLLSSCAGRRSGPGSRWSTVLKTHCRNPIGRNLSRAALEQPEGSDCSSPKAAMVLLMNSRTLVSWVGTHIAGWFIGVTVIWILFAVFQVLLIAFDEDGRIGANIVALVGGLVAAISSAVVATSYMRKKRRTGART
jgi:hypothetical protein